MKYGNHHQRAVKWITALIAPLKSIGQLYRIFRLADGDFKCFGILHASVLNSSYLKQSPSQLPHPLLQSFDFLHTANMRSVKDPRLLYGTTSEGKRRGGLAPDRVSLS
jgi:hypothetical protein